MKGFASGLERRNGLLDRAGARLLLSFASSGTAAQVTAIISIAIRRCINFYRVREARGAF